MWIIANRDSSTVCRYNHYISYQSGVRACRINRILNRPSMQPHPIMYTSTHQPCSPPQPRHETRRPMVSPQLSSSTASSAAPFLLSAAPLRLQTAVSRCAWSSHPILPSTATPAHSTPHCLYAPQCQHAPPLLGLRSLDRDGENWISSFVFQLCITRVERVVWSHERKFDRTE
jgi:hypothetical protein